jgi:type I restriction enzyme M protein
MDKDLRLRAREKLQEQYPENQIVAEPEIPNTSARPDFGVRNEQDPSYLLLVECSSMRTRHRRQEDISSLKRMMRAGDANYGALISDEIEYVFELTEFEGELVEREIPAYPNGRGGEFDDVLSERELEFRLLRARDLVRDIAHPHEYHYHLFHALFRKLVAEQEGIKYEIQSLDENWISQADDVLAEKYPPYDPTAAPENVEIQRRILQSFEGVDIGKIQSRAARAFTQLVESSRSASQYMTPLRVADAIVDLAGPTDGDRVLDPAAGIGNLIREAAAQGSEASAIEINRETVNAALFLNAVHDTQINYQVADFLTLALQTESSLPDDLDHVLIDPPFGLHYERPDGTRERNAEELFVLEALKRLRPGGVVTTVVLQGSLFKQQSQEFREKITGEYRLSNILEINEPIFQHTAVPTAIIQIVNEPAQPGDEVQYQIIGDSDSDDELERAVQTLRDGDAPTLQLSDLHEKSFLPSEVIGVEQVTERLHERYEHVVELGEYAKDIRTGVKRPETTSESGPGNLPYLRPQDVSDAEPEEYMPRENAEVTAGPGDVLLSVKGHTSVVYAPKTEVVPASNWAVLRFDSMEEALVYATFFESELGQEQLETMRTGSTIPYIPLRRLREVLIPRFSDDEVAEKADRIQSLREKARKFKRQRAALEADLDEIV